MFDFVKKYIPNVGRIVADKTLGNILVDGGRKLDSVAREKGAKHLDGYQMKYIYYFDKELEKKHKSIPFDQIPQEVRMYKGEKIGALQSD